MATVGEQLRHAAVHDRLQVIYELRFLFKQQLNPARRDAAQLGVTLRLIVENFVGMGRQILCDILRADLVRAVALGVRLAVVLDACRIQARHSNG